MKLTNSTLMDHIIIVPKDSSRQSKAITINNASLQLVPANISRTEKVAAKAFSSLNVRANFVRVSGFLKPTFTKASQKK